MKRFFIILFGALCLCGHAAAQTQADFSRLTEDNHPRLLFTDKSFKDLKGIIRGSGNELTYLLHEKAMAVADKAVQEKEPLKFELDVIQQKNYRAYRIVKDPELGNVVEAETPEGFLPYFSFTEDPHFPQDFIYVHAYCVQQPDSAFRTKIFMHKLTAEKQWALLNPTPDSPEYALRIWNNGEVSLTPIHSKEKLLSVLTEVFGLNYSIGDLPEVNRKVLL